MTMILPYSPNRYSIRITVTSIGNMCVSLTEIPPNSTFFPFPSTAVFDEIYDLQHHGDIVRQQLWIGANAADFSCEVVETFLERQ